MDRRDQAACGPVILVYVQQVAGETEIQVPFYGFHHTGQEEGTDCDINIGKVK